jgi:hypothetical protein
MPVKKKRAAHKKRKYTQKQKQKQKQSVNVKVSTGGGGGGTSFIPMPMSQAPQFDIGQLLQGLGTIRPPPTVPAPIAESIREPVAEVIPRDELRAARMGPLQGGIAAEPVRARKERSDKGKSKSRSVMGGPTESMRFVDEPMMSGAVSEGEGLARSQQYYRSSGYIPPESAGRGKKVGYEEDIFGISRPKTSDIRGSSSFESVAPTKSKVVSMSDLMSSIGSGSAQQTGGGGMSFAE